VRMASARYGTTWLAGRSGTLPVNPLIAYSSSLAAVTISCNHHQMFNPWHSMARVKGLGPREERSSGATPRRLKGESLISESDYKRECTGGVHRVKVRHGKL